MFPGRTTSGQTGKAIALNPRHAKRPYDHIILVLQGGGALGAYQAGVFEGMTKAGYLPNWVTGVSIGAVNGALIAGNPPKKRIERLRAFWDRVSSGVSLAAPPFFSALHQGFAQTSATLGSVIGVPGFFVPRMPPPAFMPDGTLGALSVYDVNPLRTTLGRLVDFDLIKRRDVRLSVGAVNVRTGSSIYFDNLQTRVGPEHVLASGALPPAFAPVEIDGEYYWDGGIVSNTPIWYAIDHSPAVNVLIVQVDLFSAEGALPRNLDQVVERHKDIMYSSKTRFDSAPVRETHRQRGALRRLLQKLPAHLKVDPDVKMLEAAGRRGRIDIVRLINRRDSSRGCTKDYEFSRSTINELWAAGLEDARCVVAHPQRLIRTELSDSVRVYDLMREPPEEGESDGMINDQAAMPASRESRERSESYCIAGARSCGRAGRARDVMWKFHESNI
jgi:NTE family protein